MANDGQHKAPELVKKQRHIERRTSLWGYSFLQYTCSDLGSGWEVQMVPDLWLRHRSGPRDRWFHRDKPEPCSTAACSPFACWQSQRGLYQGWNWQKDKQKQPISQPLIAGTLLSCQSKTNGETSTKVWLTHSLTHPLTHSLKQANN